MRFAKRSPIFVLLACGLSLVGFQTAKGAPSFLAHSWQSEDSLPSNIVHAVAQAADGYLWVGKSSKGAFEIVEAEIYEPLTAAPR